jgi:hypothetical protein
MGSRTKPPTLFRGGEPLRIGREKVSFGRNIVVQSGSSFSLKHRLFVNDPWELIAEAIHRSLPDSRMRDIAHKFRRQAEDYFHAATIVRELAVRPVLLYYAFLNLAKSYALAKGNTKLAGGASHGVSAGAKPRAVPGSIIKFEAPSTGRPKVFQELLQHLDGNPALPSSQLQLGLLLPQILPGHRLWCYATNRMERFLTVESFDVYHSPATKHVWLNVYVNKNELDQLGVSEARALSEADLAGEFDIASGVSCGDLICFQQKVPEHYVSNPAEALVQIIQKFRNKIWETVKVSSPYRKHYVYCCPSIERRARMPQMLSVYLLMFFLGSVTRYSPGYFEDLLDSKYGPLFQTFVSESPMQFLYLMASDILGCEVSKPAII